MSSQGQIFDCMSQTILLWESFAALAWCAERQPTAAMHRCRAAPRTLNQLRQLALQAMQGKEVGRILQPSCLTTAVMFHNSRHV
jgi:hypothetical protein